MTNEIKEVVMVVFTPDGTGPIVALLCHLPQVFGQIRALHARLMDHPLIRVLLVNMPLMKTCKGCRNAWKTEGLHFMEVPEFIAMIRGGTKPGFVWMSCPFKRGHLLRVIKGIPLSYCNYGYSIANYSLDNEKQIKTK